MSCQCQTTKNSFGAEVCIHFPGIENLDKSPVFVFPILSVCMECGDAEFVIPEEELWQLRSTSFSASSGGNHS
jgi:hypothetical protein